MMHENINLLDFEEPDETTFSCGFLENPSEGDERFASKEDAIEAAIERNFDDSVYGIWEDATGELLCIVYGREAFIK